MKVNLKRVRAEVANQLKQRNKKTESQTSEQKAPQLDADDDFVCLMLSDGSTIVSKNGVSVKG
jgi:hypothetical protein